MNPPVKVTADVKPATISGVFTNYHDGVIDSKTKNSLVASYLLATGLLPENIKIHVPFKNICESCHGTGVFPSKLKENEIQCPDCGGDGIKTVECKYCQGTGEVIHVNPGEDGQGVEVKRPCKHCDTTGQFKFSKNKIMCRTCKGKGKIIRYEKVSDPVGYYVCRECHGTGTKDGKNPERPWSNSVLSNTAAEELKKKISGSSLA